MIHTKFSNLTTTELLRLKNPMDLNDEYTAELYMRLLSMRMALEPFLVQPQESSSD